jgi:hypothetical protein
MSGQPFLLAAAQGAQLGLAEAPVIFQHQAAWQGTDPVNDWFHSSP